MDFIKDFIYVNKTAGNKALKSIKKNWLIIFTGLLYTTLNLAVFWLITIFLRGPLYILSGILIAIVTSSLISNYLYLLFNIINYNRMTLQDFKQGFTYFIWKIYGVLFIGYLANLLLSFIYPMIGDFSSALSLIISISIVIFLNPLPETIYLKHYESLENIIYSFEFIQANWLNWLLPNAILTIVLFFLTGHILTGLFNTHLAFNYIENPIYMVRYLLGQFLFSLMMIFRGHLFKILSTSTRRKRMFMNKF